jgi:hypothetical protein
MEEIKTFTGAELNTMLKMDEAINAVHNHEVFMHHLPDNGSLTLSIINTIVLIYVVYKLNTNKNR